MTEGSMQEMAALTSAEVDLIRTASQVIGTGLKGIGWGLGKIVAFFTAIVQKEKLLGKTNCKDILKKVVEQGGEVQYLRIEEKDRELFKELSKKYGLLYSPLKDLNKDDGKFEVMFHSSHASVVEKIMKEGNFGELIKEEEYYNNTHGNSKDKSEVGFTQKLMGTQTLLKLEAPPPQESNLITLDSDLSSWRQDSLSNISPAVANAISKDKRSILLGANGSDYMVVSPSSVDVAGTLMAGKSIEIFTKDGVLKHSLHTAKDSIENTINNVCENSHIEDVMLLDANSLNKGDIQFLVNNNLSSEQQRDFLMFSECEKRTVMIENPNEFMKEVFGTGDKKEYQNMIIQGKNPIPQEVKSKLDKTPIVPKGSVVKQDKIIDKLEKFNKSIPKTAVPAFNQAISKAKPKVPSVGGK